MKEERGYEVMLWF